MLCCVVLCGGVLEFLFVFFVGGLLRVDQVTNSVVVIYHMNDI